MRVFVCDDEPLAVRRLVALLANISDVELVASTTDPREALTLIAGHRPELLILDIEMPEVNGFDIVEGLGQLDLQTVPLIAFVTAFRSFAFDAFECGAIDFLSKPVPAARIEGALARARDALLGREARTRLTDLELRLQVLRADGGAVERDHVWVSRRGEVVRIDFDQVERVCAEGAYVRLHLREQSYLYREPITRIAVRLDPARFLRVHRSHLVRIDGITTIRRTMHGGGELVLRGGERIPLGRKYSSEVRRRLNIREHDDHDEGLRPQPGTTVTSTRGSCASD